jgi:hypothetical protein
LRKAGTLFLPISQTFCHSFLHSPSSEMPLSIVQSTSLSIL